MGTSWADVSLPRRGCLLRAQGMVAWPWAAKVEALAEDLPGQIQLGEPPKEVLGHPG